jgi:hypothetical protein
MALLQIRSMERQMSEARVVCDPDHAANDEGTASRHGAPQGRGRGKASRDPVATADSYLRPEG